MGLRRNPDIAPHVGPTQSAPTPYVPLVVESTREQKRSFLGQHVVDIHGQSLTATVILPPLLPCFSSAHRLAPNVHVVRGDFEESTSFPESKVVQIGQFRVGLVHGHQIVPWGDPNALAMTQRQLGADILITGHTHRNQVNEFGGRWFINPGSITGAYSALETEAVPSFILLAVQGAKCVTYVYELHGDQVEVSKSEFSKAS